MHFEGVAAPLCLKRATSHRRKSPRRDGLAISSAGVEEFGATRASLHYSGWRTTARQRGARYGGRESTGFANQHVIPSFTD